MLATPSNESRGSHGSQPQTSIDPVIMAAATVLRLRTIVSREIAPSESAVLTIASLQAGTKQNIIPDEATMKLNVRTYGEDTRGRHVRIHPAHLPRGERGLQAEQDKTLNQIPSNHSPRFAPMIHPTLETGLRAMVAAAAAWLGAEAREA